MQAFLKFFLIWPKAYLPECSFLVVVDDVVEKSFDEELEDEEDEEDLGVGDVGIEDFIDELRKVRWLWRRKEEGELH